MESTVELGMEDMFEERDLDQDGAVEQGMVDTEAGEDDRDENGDLQSQAVRAARDMSKGAAKKVVKNPQPKLDAARLNSDRGFPALREIFEEVKFKGKGHEISDFLVMMRTMEHWAHRLFPKMTFDEVIDRCERLGAKNQVKTILRKIRMGMPVRDEDFVERGESDDENQGGNHHDRQDNENSNADDELDDLLRDVDDDVVAEPISVHSQAPPTSQAPPPRSPPKSPVFGLNADQKERMERNKRLAMEKRLARLRSVQNMTSDPVSSSTSSQPSSTSNNDTASTRHENDVISSKTVPSSADESREMTDLARSHSRQKTESERDDDGTDLEKSETAHCVVAERGLETGEKGAEDEILKELDDEFNVDEEVNAQSESLYLRLESQTQSENSINLRLSESETNSESKFSSQTQHVEGDRGCELSPRMVDSVVNQEDGGNTVNIDTESCGLELRLDPDSSPVSRDDCGGKMDSENMEVDS